MVVAILISIITYDNHITTGKGQMGRREHKCSSISKGVNRGSLGASERAQRESIQGSQLT